MQKPLFSRTAWLVQATESVGEPVLINSEFLGVDSTSWESFYFQFEGSSMGVGWLHLSCIRGNSSVILRYDVFMNCAFEDELVWNHQQPSHQKRSPFFLYPDYYELFYFLFYFSTAWLLRDFLLSSCASYFFFTAPAKTFLPYLSSFFLFFKELIFFWFKIMEALQPISHLCHSCALAYDFSIFLWSQPSPFPHVPSFYFSFSDTENSGLFPVT